MKTNLFVANWKMNKDFASAIDFCIDHKIELQQLSSQSGTEIVLCPSFSALFSIAEILSDTLISVGAQTVSAHEKGAYTGQVSALSLKEAGCEYCIVGHSEQRQFGCISNEDVGQQVARLIKHEIQPIICIGETKEAYEADQSLAILEQQLKPILLSVTQSNFPFSIAYEPIWSIGTGIIPEHDYLNEIFDWLAQKVKDAQLSNSWRLLYGGSVNPDNAAILKKISLIHGFLIGGASLDFQKLKNLVLLGK